MEIAVLVAGIIAAVLNLILPQEDAPDVEEEDEAHVEIVDVEARHQEHEKEKHP